MTKVYVPKIGDVRIFQSQEVAEQTKSATLRGAADGKWYVFLVVEFEMTGHPDPECQHPPGRSGSTSV